MIEKRDVLRRLSLGHGIRAIHRQTGMHRTLIRALRDLARDQGWLVPGENMPSEEAIALLLKEREPRTAPEHLLEAWRDHLARWLKEGLSLVVIHRRLAEGGVAVSEPTVRRFIQSRMTEKKPAIVVPRTHVPGQVMEVDFGSLGICWDPVGERSRKAWLFSGRLRYSRKAWREIVFDQKAETFFACHVHAFEFFGGVPATVVPDNLKAAVITASFDDPQVNKSYHLLAEHYGFLIDPCLPYHPRHKGGVESDIKYVTGNFWKDYVCRQREIGDGRIDALDAQAALRRWSDTVADTRQIRGVGASVDELFVTEKPALKPLPPCRWQPVSWHRAKVQETWRIQYRKAYYTVPYRFVGKDVSVMERGREIVIFHDGQEIARHQKAGHPWATVECPSHQPPEAEAYLECTKDRIERLAAGIGPSAETVVAGILENSVVVGLRPARALLALGKKHGQAALEQACRLALAYDCMEYRVIKSLVAKGVDPGIPGMPASQERFAFAREEGFYAVAGRNR